MENVLGDSSLAPTSIKFKLNSNEYALKEPKRKKLRVLMAELIDITEKFRSLVTEQNGVFVIREDAPKGDVLRFINVALEFLKTCAPRITDDDMDYATDEEITTAFAAVAEFLSGPFVREQQASKQPE